MDRRRLLSGGIFALAATGRAGAETRIDREQAIRPGLEFVFRVRATLGAPIEQGSWDNQRHRTIPITGGIVEGPRFKGKVLPGGADWQTLRVSDGNTKIFARYTLQHEDGTFVTVTNPGVRRGPAEVMARLAAGEVVDPASYYFRASPQMEAPPGPHGWLEQNTFVCVGKRWPDAVDLDMYVVL
ncbi:MAG: DUF3237 domain-containing protein [Caulobacteraceae bacterium]